MKIINNIVRLYVIWLSLFVLIANCIVGCSSYSYANLDYEYCEGSLKHESGYWYVPYGYETSSRDMYFYCAIGQKKFDDFNSSKSFIVDTVTKRIFEKNGYCRKGYDVQWRESGSTGDHGFSWRVMCKPMNQWGQIRLKRE